MASALALAVPNMIGMASALALAVPNMIGKPDLIDREAD